MSEALPLEELKALLEKATPGPWAYRPDQYDDWGFIRGPEVDVSYGRAKPIVAISRDAPDSLDHAEHRVNGSDPYEANGKLIVAAINALPSLLSTQERLRAALEESADFLISQFGSAINPSDQSGWSDDDAYQTWAKIDAALSPINQEAV